MSNAAQRKPGEANPIVQLAILIAILAAILNVGFFFVSDAYFADRAKRFGPLELERLSGARFDFAIFSIVVAAGAILAALRPRAVAHGIPVLAGAASLLAGFAALGSDTSVVLALTLIVVAGLFELLVFRSLQGSRAAWSCLAALCIVYGVVMLFGAPKLRGILGVGMWVAMIVPGLLAVATSALRAVRDDYREEDAATVPAK